MSDNEQLKAELEALKLRFNVLQLEWLSFKASRLDTSFEQELINFEASVIGWQQAEFERKMQEARDAECFNFLSKNETH